MVTALTFDRKHIPGLVVPPLHARIEGRRVWAVVISGYLFHFVVSNRKPEARFWGGFLQENGNFPLHRSDIRDVAYLQKWGSEIAAAEASARPRLLSARIADSSSTNAVNFSSARTTKRFPSSRCASAIQIVRPLESIAEP